MALGLSPRLRGNRLWLTMTTLETSWCGSIPAPAGEPRVRAEGPWPVPTALGSIPAPAGEPQHGVGSCSPQRSIPAPAGEPPSSCRHQLRYGSIPAPAGEPPVAVANLAKVYGVRSIPAPAGEPIFHRHGRRHAGLSPRLRGNHLRALASTASLEGLSPRLRGNRHTHTG